MYRARNVVYGLGSLGRKKRRYADPGASTSQMPDMVKRAEFNVVAEQLRKVMEFMHQHLRMNMDETGLSRQQQPPPPPPPHDQQQPPQIDHIDPPQQGDNVERETQELLTRDEQLAHFDHYQGLVASLLEIDYHCTNLDYALEMWRLLDPEAHLISLKELMDREKPLSLKDIRMLIVLLRQALWQLLWIFPSKPSTSRNSIVNVTSYKRLSFHTIQHKVSIATSELLMRVCENLMALLDIISLQDWNNRRQFTPHDDFHAQEAIDECFVSQVMYRTSNQYFVIVNNEYGEQTEEELLPGGKDIRVTNENVVTYIHLIANHRLNFQNVAISVGGWFFDRVGVSAIDCPYPCDNTCHNLVFKGFFSWYQAMIMKKLCHATARQLFVCLIRDFISHAVFDWATRLKNDLNFGLMPELFSFYDAKLSVKFGDFLLSRACVALASLRNTEGVLARGGEVFNPENLNCARELAASHGIYGEKHDRFFFNVGNYIPISPVRDDVSAAYKKGMEWKAEKKEKKKNELTLMRYMKVEAEIVQIEEDDVPVAISNEVSKSLISVLVIGASSGGSFTSACRAENTRMAHSENVPFVLYFVQDRPLPRECREYITCVLENTG
ncbi:hypothetical protein Syun_020458 [Stephania yunnanensis]|uniref:HECT-type E3 ubiquitin transferase n=1 Tax=Stephania yunnanensis TaxID=152371 RepID=A0AAP0IDY0_9MAGN